MIQPNELRKNNLLLDVSGLVEKVHGIVGDHIVILDPKMGEVRKDKSEFYPIELTEEWLIKFSFEKYDWQDAYFIKACKKHLFIQFFKGEILTFFTKVTRDSGGHKTNGREKFNIGYELKYIHQIQNLYFALTGQELTIK